MGAAPLSPWQVKQVCKVLRTEIYSSVARTILENNVNTVSANQYFFTLIMFILPKRFFLSVSAFQKGWFEAINFIKKDKIKVWTLSLLSIFLWFLHLLQIWLFILSLSPNVDFIVSLAITPLAIFAGLIPLTFSGIGTRDFAFIYFYSAYFSAATGAALGILAMLRYVIPAIVGIPFFSHYLKKKK